MAKVVGQDQSAYKRITCRRCAAIVEYVENEVRLLRNYADIDGGRNVEYGIICPQCSNEIITKHY